MFLHCKKHWMPLCIFKLLSEVRKSNWFYSAILRDGFFLFPESLKFSSSVSNSFIAGAQFPAGWFKTNKQTNKTTATTTTKVFLYENSSFLRGLTICFLCMIFTVIPLDLLWRETALQSILEASLPHRALHLRVHVSNTHILHYHQLSQLRLLSVPQPSCYHSYSYKELKFLPTLAFFFQSGNKAWSEDGFDEMAGKTAFLHWRFENIARVFWDPFVSTAFIYLCFIAFGCCCFRSVCGSAPLWLCSCQAGSAFTDLLYLTSFLLRILNPIWKRHFQLRDAFIYWLSKV